MTLPSASELLPKAFLLPFVLLAAGSPTVSRWLNVALLASKLEKSHTRQPLVIK